MTATVGTTAHPVSGTLAVTGAMTIFGVNNVIVRTTNISGAATASLRLFLGAGLLLAVMVAARRRPRLDSLRVALPAGIAYGAAVLLFFNAFKETSIANATLIAALQSGVSLTVVGRFFGERVRAGEFALTAIATGGVALVILGGEAGGAGRLHGDLLAIGGMLANTAYFVLAKQTRARSPLSADSFQFGLLVVASIMTVPVVLVSGPLPTPDGGDWVRLVLLAAGGTLGHLGINWAHRHVTFITVSLMTLAVPVVSSTIAWAVLDERLAAVQWFGAAVTLVSLATVVLRAVRPAPPDHDRTVLRG